MRKTIRALAGALCLGAASTASAQTDTIFGAPGAQVMSVGSIYIGAGGQFQSLGMPKYNLGFAKTDTAFNDQGAVVEHRVRVDVFGGTGMVGYVFGGLPPWLGSNPRLELGGFLAASGGANDFGSSREFGGTPLLNGFIRAFGCNPCDWTSSLKRDAEQFRIWLMFGADHAVAPDWFLTPSLGAIGGRIRVSDELFQTFATPGSAPVLGAHYAAATNLKWWDVGGRAKLVLTWKATPWLAVFAGGHVDLTTRHASFAGEDEYSNGFGRSSVSGSATRLNFATGGQFGLTLSDGNWLLVSVIGGIDYDNKVPRIDRPFGGNLAANSGTFQTPARLAFSSAVNYSAQLRVVIRIF